LVNCEYGKPDAAALCRLRIKTLPAAAFGGDARIESPLTLTVPSPVIEHAIFQNSRSARSWKQSAHSDLSYSRIDIALIFNRL